MSEPLKKIDTSSKGWSDGDDYGDDSRKSFHGRVTRYDLNFAPPPLLRILFPTLRTTGRVQTKKGYLQIAFSVWKYFVSSHQKI